MNKKKNFFGFDRENPFSWIIPILLAGFVVPLIITLVLYVIFV